MFSLVKNSLNEYIELINYYLKVVYNIKNKIKNNIFNENNIKIQKTDELLIINDSLLMELDEQKIFSSFNELYFINGWNSNNNSDLFKKIEERTPIKNFKLKYLLHINNKK